MSIRHALIAAAAAPWLALSAPAPALTLTALAGACTGDSNTGSAPVSAQANCASVHGSFEGSAHASPGSVGASASASTFSSIGAGNSRGQAIYTDTITFTKIDPNAPDLMPVSLNLNFGGSINAGEGPFGGASAEYRFAVNGFLGSFNGRGVFSTETGLEIIASGLGDGVGVIAPGPGGFNLGLATPTTNVNFFGAQSVQVILGFSVLAITSSRGAGGSASADFGNTLEFPTGVPVFNLPAGYTVNAGDYLVNNRFVDPNGVGAVPEPAIWAMLIFGFGLTGGVARGAARRARGKPRPRADRSSPDSRALD